MRAMLCGCGRHLEASGYEGLVRELLEHLGLDHPEIGLGEAPFKSLERLSWPAPITLSGWVVSG